MPTAEPASSRVASAGSATWLGQLVVAGAILWHLLAVLGPPSTPVPPHATGRDFASYFYAARVSADGLDPYDKGNLVARARQEGTRSEVHPYLYPPPFLGLVAWSIPLSLRTSAWIWFALNELALLGTILALARWWRPLGAMVVPILAVLVALMYGVAYTAELRQANFLVLLLAVLGLWQEERRPALAGAAVGLAAMMKMSPAILVLWWLVRGQRLQAGAALGTALAASLLALPLAGPETQLAFYTEVLPRLGAGDYGGLTIKIEMFGNHSLPNLWHQYLPSDTGRLSGPARALSGVSGLLVVGGLLLAFARPTADRVKLAAQGCALLVGMLLVPVYTYEHHLVFALPAMALSVLALARGWLSPRWSPLLAAAIPILCVELSALRLLAMDYVTPERPVLYLWIQEAKMLALLIVGAAMVRLGASAWVDPTRPPPPRPV